MSKISNVQQDKGSLQFVLSGSYEDGLDKSKFNDSNKSYKAFPTKNIEKLLLLHSLVIRI